ncbi:MAG: CRISPR-associated helicase Cas3', partial [Thermodesulfovibrio sp.]|nr:CRISPR-associated helicase Cas3' [Thermodesulfovibrio sp.]
KRLSNGSFEKIDLYKEEEAKYKNLKKHVLKVDTRSWQEVLEEIRENAKNNKKVLVILNTIKKAEEIFEKVRDVPNLPTELLHSEMTLKEKEERKKKIEYMLSKNNSNGCVVVSTQVIEAGMDIDADILYTELCPMDVLVQRMGRVLRRYKEKYDITKDHEALKPNIILVIDRQDKKDKQGKEDKDKKYESGRGGVYDNELLEKTLILLHRKVDFTVKNPNKQGVDKIWIWEEYYENFRHGEREEKLRKGKAEELIKETQIELSEYEKYQLVESLYEALNPNGKYLSGFYNTLDVLDAGYMSDKREEAQEIFRRINNISTIHFLRFEELKEQIKKLIREEQHLTYVSFKDSIIRNFVIQKQFYKVPKERRKRLYFCLVNAKEQILGEVQGETGISKDKMIRYEEKYEKIVEWSRDLFIVCEEGEEEEFKNCCCYRGNII